MTPSPTSPIGPDPASFRELGEDECRERLGHSSIGRVAWCGPRGPQVLPVTIALSDGAVVFRTAANGQLARGIRRAVVAIEVDEIDPTTRSGWSVLVVGRAELVGEPGELVQLWLHHDPQPWAAGMRTLFVRVQPERITGRQVSPASDVGAAGANAHDQ